MSQESVAETDPVLTVLVREASGDPDVLGVLLSGSRGAGYGDAQSDYDVVWVLTDNAFTRRATPDQIKQHTVGQPPIDHIYTCPANLAPLAAQPDWRTFGYATARVLLDKTGAVTHARAAIALVPEERARQDAAAWFDAYLNAFYRSLKAWRRGNELGARLQAAESAMHLVRALFALERHWPPYHDRLEQYLAVLDRQGWPAGVLREALLDLVRTADPTRQQALAAQVEALLRRRGFGYVVERWGGEIERVRAWRFA